ncbi:GFRAL protein, partial [Nyctiprogne leucopyga]|nr:GFRAL protein [Nyctiprogne leucopyga]
VLFMYFTSISAAQTADCVHLREQCINAANGCGSVWNIVEDVCNISGTELSFRQHRSSRDQRHPEELENDCSITKQHCREDPYCFLVYKSFQQACQVDTAKYNISTETKLQWSLSALSKQAYTTNRTCLDVNKECVEDEVCNKQLSLYLKVCSVNKKCNMEECQAAIRFFYQNMPFEVAQMMTFCDCNQPDESCHRAKELLHGKPCAVTAVPSPSCLNVIHMCEENELKKYTTFQSKCWRHVTKKCYNDKACLETLIKGDMPCSANADCKAAYISNWGTMLRMECTCQNLPPTEHSLCKLFHHILHSKSCFS